VRSRIQQQIAAQQAYHDNLVRQNRYRGGTSSSSSSSSGSGSGSGSGSYNSHRYAPSYASASGSIGSNGYRQTAFISPSNPVRNPTALCGQSGYTFKVSVVSVNS